MILHTSIFILITVPNPSLTAGSVLHKRKHPANILTVKSPKTP
jgi:hypothetical protein